jgi:hypothetical protein
MTTNSGNQATSVIITAITNREKMTITATTTKNQRQATSKITSNDNNPTNQWAKPAMT